MLNNILLNCDGVLETPTFSWTLNNLLWPARNKYCQFGVAMLWTFNGINASIFLNYLVITEATEGSFFQLLSIKSFSVPYYGISWMYGIAVFIEENVRYCGISWRKCTILRYFVKKMYGIAVFREENVRFCGISWRKCKVLRCFVKKMYGFAEFREENVLLLHYFISSDRYRIITEQFTGISVFDRNIEFFL